MFVLKITPIIDVKRFILLWIVFPITRVFDFKAVCSFIHILIPDHYSFLGLDPVIEMVDVSFVGRLSMITFKAVSAWVSLPSKNTERPSLIDSLFKPTFLTLFLTAILPVLVLMTSSPLSTINFLMCNLSAFSA